MKKSSIKTPPALYLRVLISIFLIGGILNAESFSLSSKQLKIEKFLKANYCEIEEIPQDEPPPEPPLGYFEESEDSGAMDELDDSEEDNFCVVKRNIEINPVIKVLADDKIEVKAPSFENPEEKFVWNFVRKGKVPAEIKQLVFRKLTAMQLPKEELEDTLFQVWKTNLDEDSYEEILVHAFYKKLANEVELKGHRCELTILLDKKNRHEPEFAITTFNKIPYKEVDFEIDSDIQKFLYDIRDVDGDKKLEIILIAEGYEASWLEVYGKRTQGWHLLYKGLGYSL